MGYDPSDHWRRCEARRTDGQPCQGPAVTGTQPGRCRVHIGRSKAVTSVIAEAGRMVKRAGVDKHPLEHLMDSLYRAAAEVEVWGQMVADLDNAGEIEITNEPGRLRGYAEYESVYDGNSDKYRQVLRKDPLLVNAKDGGVKIHPFVDEYHAALERRARFAKMAMDVGVAERQVALAETQAAQVAGVIRSILTELGVQQDRRTVMVVQNQLRALSPAVEKKAS